MSIISETQNFQTLILQLQAFKRSFGNKSSTFMLRTNIHNFLKEFTFDKALINTIGIKYYNKLINYFLFQLSIVDFSIDIANDSSLLKEKSKQFSNDKFPFERSKLFVLNSNQISKNQTSPQKKIDKQNLIPNKSFLLENIDKIEQKFKFFQFIKSPKSDMFDIVKNIIFQKEQIQTDQNINLKHLWKLTISNNYKYEKQNKQNLHPQRIQINKLNNCLSHFQEEIQLTKLLLIKILRQIQEVPNQNDDDSNSVDSKNIQKRSLLTQLLKQVSQKSFIEKKSEAVSLQQYKLESIQKRRYSKQILVQELDLNNWQKKKQTPAKLTNDKTCSCLIY